MGLSRPHVSRAWMRVRPWLVPVALLGTWEIAARCKWLPPEQIAPPSIIVRQLADLLFAGPLARHIAISMSRLLIGVALGTVAGVASGVSLSRLPRLDALFSPSIRFLSAVPVIVWLPLAIVCFGTGDAFKVGLCALATFFLVHVHSYEATSELGARYLEVADIYEKHGLQRFVHVLFPATIPAILTAVRIAIVLGWIVIFFVEYAVSLQGAEGLGWFIADARQVGRVEDEYAGMFSIGILGFCLDAAIAALQRRVSRWNPGARQKERIA